MEQSTGTGLAALAVLGLLLLVLARQLRGRRAFGTVAERAAYQALHEASLASPALRRGLTEQSATTSAGHLRALLGSAAVSLTSSDAVLAWDGAGSEHAQQSRDLAAQVLASGRPVVGELRCPDPDCPVRSAAVAPLVVDDHVVGTLGAYVPSVAPGLVRAVGEVGRWVAGQLELAELDASRARVAEAQLRALRAQISPHFVYNALTAIASFVRTDPERARELLLDFADFTRYSSRSHGEFTSLAEELRSIERYLLLERARFGERLTVTLRVAPEVLAVAVPYLCLQPLVENAVKHGLESGSGCVTIVADDVGTDCVVSVEDDGAGSDPERVRAVLAGTAVAAEPEPDPSRRDPPREAHESVGLANVDARLRALYGEDHGLVVETAPGAGTKVTLTLPKFTPGVRAS